MKKNGFTLVELIGSLVIIVAIFSIVLPNIESSINKSSDTAMKKSLDNLVISAGNYFSLNIYDIPTYESDLELHDITELKEENYAEKLPKDTEGVFFITYLDQYTYVTNVILKKDGVYYSSIENLNKKCDIYKGLCSTEYVDYYNGYCRCN